MREKKIITILGICFFVAGVLTIKSCAQKNFRGSSRESANIAPLPEKNPQAIVQIYAAKLWGWRGVVADHTWVATKAKNSDSYTVYEVIGWRLRHGNTALRIEKDLPDRRWYGSEPKLLLDIQGDAAVDLVEKVDKAARTYPYPDIYSAFPGPNSNTFTAWIINEVEEIKLELPLRAIGKSYSLNADN